MDGDTGANSGSTPVGPDPVGSVDPDPVGAAQAADAEPAEATAAGPRYAPPGRTHGTRLFFRIGRTVIALLSVAVLVTSWYAWANLRHLNNTIARTGVLGDNTPGAVAPQADGSGSPPPLDSALNILVVGMDSRTDPQGNPLPDNELAMLSAGPDSGELDTDTMILIHVPAGGQRAVAISFPRDSYVQLAGGYGTNRLNSAFAYAHNAKAGQLRAHGDTDRADVERQADDAGRANLIATIEQLIGNTLRINEYAEVNLVGFYNLAQAVGGVQVCLKAPTYDDETHAHFPAGVQTVSGVQALDFVRERHGLPRGDLDRIVRQQVFIGSLANKILSANTLANPSKLASLIQAVQGSVVLSAGWDITTFAQQMSGLTSGNIEFATIPTGDNFTTSGGAEVTRVYPSQVRQFVSSMVSASDNGTSSADTPANASTTNASTTDTSTEGVTPTTSGTAVGGGSPGKPALPTTSDPTSGNGVITANGIPCVN